MYYKLPVFPLGGYFQCLLMQICYHEDSKSRFQGYRAYAYSTLQLDAPLHFKNHFLKLYQFKISPAVHKRSCCSAFLSTQTFWLLNLCQFCVYKLHLVVLICTFSIAEIEHIFKCSLPICISSTVKYLFPSFVHMSFGFLIFSLLISRSSSHILVKHQIFFVVNCLS